MENYGRELRMGVDLRKKEKMEKATEFVKRMRKMQKETEAALMRAQEEMKRQMDGVMKETKVWKIRDKVMLSIKNLVFKERLVKKLIDRYVSPYIIEKVVSTNAVKLQLQTSMRIHLVVNVSRIV